MKLYHQLTLLLAASFTKSDAATTGKLDIVHPKKIIAVSSVAGVTSRNGRVSSIGGIRFYHTPNEVFAGSIHQGSSYQPIVKAEASAGRSASASVHYHPNSVVVSSTAGSGSIQHVNPWFPRIPAFNNIIHSPEEILEHVRSFHPWLPKNLFKYLATPNIPFKESWSYPNQYSFDSFWR